MLTQKLKLLRGAVTLAICAVLTGQAFAAAPVYLFKQYTPGVVGSYALSLSSSSLGFGSVVAGASSAPQTVTLLNAGPSPISVTALTVAAGYTQTNNCGAVLPGASCQAVVTFSPPTTDAYAGNLAVTYDGGRQATVALAGTGTPASAIGSLSSASLAFGPVQVGADATQTVTLSNSGGNNLSVSSITADNAVFTVPAGCTTVVAGTPCVIGVKFTPTTAGPVTGTLTVVDNAVGSPRTVTLSGTGNTPLANLSVPSLDLGSVTAGASNTLSVELSNTGNQDLAVSAVTVSGNAAFSATSDCISVAPSLHCTANVTFAPLSATGAVTGMLSFATNTPGSPQSVSLSGSGLPLPTYATWNPSDKSPYLILSGGNLTVTGSGSTWGGVRATKGKASGKWYWETTLQGNGGNAGMFGIANATAAITPLFNQANSYMYCPVLGCGRSYVNWVGATTVALTGQAPSATGDILMFALDMDNGAYYMGRNGIWYNSGNPASGSTKSGALATGLSGTVYPGVATNLNTATTNFGASAFTYAVPAGFNPGVY